MKTSTHKTGYIDGTLRLIGIGIFLIGYPIAVFSGSIIAKTTIFICDIWEELRPEREGDNY